jgi:hypothetical protein
MSLVLLDVTAILAFQEMVSLVPTMMNVPMEITIVMPMLLALILTDHSRVLATPVIPVTESTVLILMNASVVMSVTTRLHVLIQLVHMIVPVLLVTRVLAVFVKILTNVLLVHILVMENLLNVMIRYLALTADVLLVTSSMLFLVPMIINVLISMSVPTQLTDAMNMDLAQTTLEVTIVPVTLVSQVTDLRAKISTNVMPHHVTPMLLVPIQ